MSGSRRPIDDPEVREQHRRQARRDLRRGAIAAVLFAAFLVWPLVLATWTDAAFGPRAPATVEFVDPVRSSVTVTSSDSRVPDYLTLDVHDTGAYAVGDHVGVILTGEEREPSSLDREPILPQMIPAFVAFVAFSLVVMIIAMGVVVWLTIRRRRALGQPWRRVRVALFAQPPKHYAHFKDEDDGSYWKLEDLPDELPMHAVLDAQVAGSTRHLVVRFFGSTQLATARRRRARSEWAELLPLEVGALTKG
jgi:hypothetical protein